MVKQENRYTEKIICVNADALGQFRVRLVTKFQVVDLKKEVEEQRHDRMELILAAVNKS